MFHAVHAETASQHENQHNEERGNNLIFLHVQDCGNNVEGVVFRIQPEQVENPSHSEHSEEDESGQEEHRNNGEKIHDSVKGNQEPETGAENAFTRVEKVCRPDSEYVLHAENGDG